MNQQTMKTLTKQEAEEQGYRSLTNPYRPIAEKEFFERCKETLKGTNSVIVPNGNGTVEFWRHKSELDIFGE